jgi:hypothetical protein
MGPSVIPLQEIFHDAPMSPSLVAKALIRLIILYKS